VLLAVVLVPLLGFVACTAMVGGAVSAVDAQRQGGRVTIGETYTYASGLAVTVSQPQPYEVDNRFIVGPGEQAYEVSVTVVNGSDKPVSASLISKNATVNGAPAQEVFGSATFATQDIAPGQQLVGGRQQVEKGSMVSVHCGSLGCTTLPRSQRLPRDSDRSPPPRTSARSSRARSR